jgi:hypothetical protein
LADTGESLALRISQDIKNKLKTREDVNATVVIATDQLGKCLLLDLFLLYSNTGSIRDDPYWISRKNRLELNK